MAMELNYGRKDKIFDYNIYTSHYSNAYRWNVYKL